MSQSKIPKIHELKLGKNEHRHDNRTLMLANFFLPDIRVPSKFDFDKGRAAFPLRMWGNDAYGDCVIADRCNAILRLERIEQRRTIALYDEDAVTEYKKLTGCQSPGDENDSGLVILDAMREWKNTGLATDGRAGIRSPRSYTIAAYGELDPHDGKQLRMATYVLHGIHFGFWLPRAAQGMTNAGVWDYNGETGDDWEPGSWGGHCVFSKAFDENSMEVLTWAMKVKVTDSFIKKYCDECWAVVDSLDSWRTKQTIDVTKLTEQLHSITSKVNN